MALNGPLLAIHRVTGSSAHSDGSIDVAHIDAVKKVRPSVAASISCGDMPIRDKPLSTQNDGRNQVVPSACACWRPARHPRSAVEHRHRHGS
jgi:hypothetical protein